jgi:hypothetical protein
MGIEKNQNGGIERETAGMAEKRYGGGGRRGIPLRRWRN